MCDCSDFIICLCCPGKARRKKVKSSPTGSCNSFFYLLNPFEKDRLKRYIRKWKLLHGQDPRSDANAIFHLQDDPDVRTCWSSSGHFPSLRKSMGILWHAQSETTILPRERLALMGWPVYPMLAEAAGITPFNFPDLKRASRYAGNAYHVSMYGVWMAVCLACVRLNPE